MSKDMHDLLNIIVTNAEMVDNPDPRWQGTDIYTVPLDDIDAARTLLELERAHKPLTARQLEDMDADAALEAEQRDRHKAQATRQVENTVRVTQTPATHELEREAHAQNVARSLAWEHEKKHGWRTEPSPTPYTVTERDLALLRELWEYCDNYGEAADDSSVGAIRALNFAEPLRQLIARLESKN